MYRFSGLFICFIIPCVIAMCAFIVELLHNKKRTVESKKNWEKVIDVKLTLLDNAATEKLLQLTEAQNPQDLMISKRFRLK